MKKTIVLFISGLLILCLSDNSQAQSSENELDQTELMKQFIGKWKGDFKKDTVIYWKITPYEKGYLIESNWQARGETYQTTTGISGFTWKNRQINSFTLWSDGMLSRDLGKFIAKDKLVLERFTADHTIKMAIWELTFLTPNKIKSVFKWKGGADDWSEATIAEWTFERVVE